MKIAVAYIRVSTNQQDLRGSKQGQEQEVINFAKKEKYNIIETFSDTEHGDIADRTGITKLKEYLRVNSSIKYVLVYHSDRFTRNFQNGMRDLFFLDDLGIKLISTLEGEIIADGTFDSLPSLVRLIGAQEDKTKLVKKTTDALYKYAQTNRYLGGSIMPWFKLEVGYVDGKKCKVIAKNEDTWNFYRNFFLEIIKTRNIKEASNRFGLKSETTSDWLNRKELLGYRSYGKKGKIDKMHNKGRRKVFFTTETPVLPALLTKSEYEQIYEIRFNNKIKFNRAEKIYLYTNVAKCKCGSGMEGNVVKKKNGKFYYYRCKKCKKYFNAEKLEKKIATKILMDKRIGMLNDYQFRIADLLDEQRELEVRINSFTEKESNIISLVAKGLTTMDIIEKELSKLKNEKQTIKNNLDKIKKEIELEAEKEITEDNIEILKKLLNHSNNTNEFRAELKEIINLIIRKVIVGSDYIFLYF